jgi:hypothetical protein
MTRDTRVAMATATAHHKAVVAVSRAAVEAASPRIEW